MNSGEILREMLGYSPRTSLGISNKFPTKAREIPGDFLANPRENTKAILMILFGNSWGNLKANPLLLYTWFGCPTRALTRPHEALQKLSKGVSQELPKTPPKKSA